MCKKWYSHGTFVMLYNFVGFNVIPCDVQLIWRDVIGFNWKWRVSTSPLHVFSTVYSLRSRFVGVSSLVSKINMYILKFACLSNHSFLSFYMADGGKRFGTCFRSSERKAVSTPPLRADFIQQSSPRSSYGPLWKTNLFHGPLYSRKYRIDLCSQIEPIAILWAVWLWDIFQPKQF